ncbi:MAG: ATP-binding protein [Kiritimatiellae bacterium]|jgi:signal transduction histidine kinase/CheY-like chemotaxis protein|nr:ATP-binding protein [Kiritimatiellia bacterium]
MGKKPLKKIRNSIRTHLGLLTAIILLSLLFVFYIGGRFILINIVRQAETEVTTVSNSIKSVILQQMNSQQTLSREIANNYAALPDAEKRTEFLKATIHPNNKNLQTQLASIFNEDGSLLEGFYSSGNSAIKAIEPQMLHPYFNSENIFTEILQSKKTVSGVISFQKIPHYISISPIFNSENKVQSILIIGSNVHGNQLFMKMSHFSHGFSINLNETKAAKNKIGEKSSLISGKISSIFDENKIFSAGGLWHIGKNSFQAIIPIFDIQGDEISSLSITFPNSFSSLTAIALGQLTVFVAIVGIIFIIPMFWLQGHIILDPLSKLEHQIKDISAKYKEDQIEYLNYKSNDEFGIVAQSVDSLLQELNRKSEMFSFNSQRQKALITSIPDCLCIFNKARVLISIEKQPDNFTSIPGLKTNHPLSPDVFKEEYVRLFNRALAKAFESRQTMNTSLACHETSSKPRYFETHITCMDDYFALVVFRDVTSDFIKRKKQERLDTHATKIQQMSSLGNLASGIAHDFNNVFTIIGNTLDTMGAASTSDSAEKEDAVFTVRQASNKGTSLVQELMTYAGQTHTNMRNLDPNNVIMELQPLYKGIINPGVALEIGNGENLHQVMVDTDQFWKVIVNLVKNATESIKSNRGYIKISTYNFDITKSNAIKFFSSHPLEPDQGVIFEVADNGAGIPQEIIDRLFEPFFSTKAVGRGLGLATVFGIVDSHNGGLSIVSHENIGTKFRVWLPAAALESDINDLSDLNDEALDAKSSTMGTLTVAESLSKSGKPCVLIIDDDHSIIKTTALLLERMGITALTATTNTEAVARFRKYHSTINMVMLDAQLGNLDSIRLLGTLRMINENLPVIICSGHSKEKVESMFMDSLIDGILIKPYTMNELRSTLSTFNILNT